MTSSLRLVSEQFPHLRERTALVFECDPAFRELCDDYETCVHALALQQASPALHHEYSALRLRLETELLGYLGDANLVRTPK